MEVREWRNASWFSWWLCNTFADYIMGNGKKIPCTSCCWVVELVESISTVNWSRVIAAFLLMTGLKQRIEMRDMTTVRHSKIARQKDSCKLDDSHHAHTCCARWLEIGWRYSRTVQYLLVAIYVPGTWYISWHDLVLVALLVVATHTCRRRQAYSTNIIILYVVITWKIFSSMSTGTKQDEDQ